MRICFISFEYPPNIIGGAGTYAKSLVDGLKANGIDVFVITKGIQNDSNNKIYRVPTPDLPYWRRLFFIRPALSLLHELDKLFGFDIVHFNEPHLIPGKLNLPTICTFHSIQFNEIKLRLAELGDLKTTTNIRDLVLKNLLGSICDISTARKADRIICPSPELVGRISSYCFVEAEKVFFVPNGIQLKKFDRIESGDYDILRKHDLERDNYLLYIGRLSYLKGAQFLIRAFKNIEKEYKNLKLAIVGTGDFEVYLRNLAHGTDGVVFTGHIRSLEVKKLLYSNCLAVVVPSLYEGLPMVVLEAMACRKPVLGSNTGGIPFLIEHGVNGFLIGPGDDKDIEKFARILIENGNLRENMGLSGRKFAEERFTLDRMVNETLGIYCSLMQV